jgi:hypothetical protein
MLFWLIILGILFVLWQLVFNGWLWRIILFSAGWVGIYVLLRAYVPDSIHQAIIISNVHYSWAAVIPTIICLLALATTRN